MPDDKKVIAVQGIRIANLEKEIESIYKELESIRHVTGGIIKATGIMPRIAENDK